VLDALIVFMAVASVLEVVLQRDSSWASQTTLWLSLPVVAIIPLPLLWRRRFPFAAPVSVWLLAAALSFVDGQLVASVAGIFLAGMFAAFLLGNLADAVQERMGLVVVVGAAAIIVYNRPDHDAASLLFTPLLFALAWLGGFAVRQRVEQAEEAEERAAQAERDRDMAARIAVAEERARIARELHDVVAHSVSVMVLQVGAVRHKLPEDQAEESEALRGVEKTGRTALAEMRRLLGAMRREDEDVELGPQPGLDALDGLLDDVGRSGLPVRLHVDGERVALPPAIDLSAYRIVQEGLTNALKHARATQADVTLRYAPDELRIEVRDDGPGGARTDGQGHGLVGVRERVKIYGGEMTAGRATDGGFVLSARLPIGEAGS
jgi:signal transduction histidine kinase